MAAAAAAAALPVQGAMPTASVGSSAAGLLALLEESDAALRVHALERLAAVVDQYWSEVASAVPLIEELSEDFSFSAHQLAAYVASKCFYHLEEYGDALRLALAAGSYFDVSAKTEYVSALVSTCIEEYISLRSRSSSSSAGGDAAAAAAAAIDPRMEAIVERMFDRCFADGEYRQAMGIALESHRLDKVEEILRRADDKIGIMQYTFEVSQTLVSSREMRRSVLKVLVAAHREQPHPDYATMCICLLFLDESSEVAQILLELIRGSEEQTLLAYQIALDLVESENQHFLVEVCSKLPKQKKAAAAAAAAAGDAGDAGAGEEKGGGEDADSEAMPLLGSESAAGAPSEERGDDSAQWTPEFTERMKRMSDILSGSFVADLKMNFLFKQTAADPLILKQVKEAIENRNSVLHNATVVTHGFLNAGTTVDSFLRNNLDWMGRASNWAKFTATASIGVVHKGHMKESMKLLQPYLPQGGVSASPFSEGGSLYALGLIHANQGTSAESADTNVIEYLRTALRNAGTNDTVLHGACLGLGLAAMAMGQVEIYEELKGVLYSDSAVAGEAASLGIGLLMLGVGNSTEVSRGAVAEMIAYAKDTQHEKIIRGLAMGIALTMYGQEEDAEPVIEQLRRDRDALLRYGAMYTIGLAYIGTANNSAIRRLLHVAVSDVSDDVRLAAVINLGFVLFRTPEQVPRLVSLLAESFNPLVRYGACMSIGIACAGTGLREAIDILDPMTEDLSDFVRQGSLIALSMVLMQQSETSIPKVKGLRTKLASIIGDKHQGTMTKMGAILATGILDAGGRNVTLSMQSRAGFTKMGSVVGLAMYCQSWYWYPLMHFLSLAMTPTMLIGLNKDFKLPRQWDCFCDAKPTLFAYPKPIEERKEEKKARITTVALSTTTKSKAREHRKELLKKGEGGGAAAAASASASASDSKGVSSSKDKQAEEGAAPTETEEGKEEEKPKAKPEPTPPSFRLSNPSRVIPVQEKYVSFDLKQRYVPVCSSSKPTGVVMLRDTMPNEPEDAASVEVPAVDGEDEAPMPDPFEWTPPEP